MPHLAGHEYLGPGTVVDKAGNPVDRDDLIALVHDIDYNSAVNYQDIAKADDFAIFHFVDDFVKTSNWHSFVGGLSLASKRVFERLFGPVYPGGPSLRSQAEKPADTFRHSFDPAAVPGGSTTFVDLENALMAPTGKGKKKKVPAIEDSGATKKIKLEDLDLNSVEGQLALRAIKQQGELPSSFNPSVQLEAIKMEASGSATVTRSSGGSSMDDASATTVSIIRNPSPKSVSQEYGKNFIFKTYAFQSVQGLEYKEGSIITTSLCCFPTWDLQFYLNFQEYLYLPPLSFVKQLYVTITPLYITTPFPTGETTAGFANSQQGCLLMSGTGLNQLYGLSAVKYTGLPADPTKPTAVSDYKCSDMSEKLYSVSGCLGMGIPRHINCYTVITEEHSDPNKWLPDLTSNVDIVPYSQVQGERILHYSYTPREGILKGADVIQDKNMMMKSMSHGAQSHRGYVNPNINDAYQGTNESLGSLSFPRGPAGTYGVYSMVGPTEVTYTTPIEKCMYISPGLDAHLTTKDMPSLHFGVIPTQNNTFGSAIKSYTEMACYWQVETMCVVESPLHSRSSVKRDYNHGHEKYWFCSSAKDADIKDFVAGNIDGVSWYKGRRLGLQITRPKDLAPLAPKNPPPGKPNRTSRDAATEENEDPPKKKLFGFM